MPLNMAEFSLAQRLAYLEENAQEKQERATVRLNLDVNQRRQMSSQATELSIAILTNKDELAERSKTLRSAIKEDEKEQVKILRTLKKGYEEKVMDLYGIPNYDMDEMNYYNKEGELVQSRKLKPNEKLHRIGTGTND